MHTGIPRPRTASFSLHISTTSSGGSTVSSSITPPSNSPSNLGRVPLDARVVLSRRRTGYVRYVGKLKSEAGEWYGVALDEAKGEHDGRWLGERHFECAPNHGVFVRRKEIFYVKEQQLSYAKSPPSPVMNDSSEDCSSGTSTSSSNTSVASHDTTDALPSHGATYVPTAVAATSSPTLSPLQRTFKSFRRVLQSPTKLGESLTVNTSASSSSSAQSPHSPHSLSPSKSLKEPTTPTRRTASSSRGSMIPPPAIASPKNHSASRHQSLAFHATNHNHDEGQTQGSVLPAALSLSVVHKEEQQRTQISHSIFEEDDCFASMTRALAEVEQEQNNLLSSLACPAPIVVSAPIYSTPIPEVPPLPPQIGTQELSRHGAFSSSSSSPPSAASSSSSASPSSPQRRLSSIDRRHSTFAFGSPMVSAAAVTAAANATRVVELEKEIVTMRTNHENVVAVLRATNKQHAANVLELRAQVSALADGTGWLQKQLSSKSSQLLELKQSERLAETQRTEMQAQLHARDHKIHALEQEITVLQSKTEAMHSEKDSVLLEMRKEFQARQQRDREQIQRLRGEVLSLVNARSALQSELRDAKEMSFLF